MKKKLPPKKKITPEQKARMIKQFGKNMDTFE